MVTSQRALVAPIILGLARTRYSMFLMGDEKNIDLYHHLRFLKHSACGDVLEIGAWRGRSTAALLTGLEERGGHLYSVDLKDYSDTYRGHPQWTFIQSDSRDEVKLLAAGVPAELDVLFIDSAHSYECTKAELMTWGKRVKPGGLILLHDVDDPAFPGQVLAAMMHFCAAYDKTAEVRPRSFGLGIIRI